MKTKLKLLVVQAYLERNSHVKLIKNGKSLLIWKFRVTKPERIRKHDVIFTEKETHRGNKCNIRSNSLCFVLKITSLLLATSTLSQRPNSKVYKTTASLDKLTCTRFVELAKCQPRFGCFFVQNTFQQRRCEWQNFEENDNRDSRPFQRLTMRDSVCNQFL